MTQTLIFCERNSSEETGFKRSSLELLSLAQKLGKKSVVVCMGKSSDALSKVAAGYGAEKFVLLPEAQFGKYNPADYAATLGSLIESHKPTTILASAGSLARDLFPRLAARLNAAIVSDVTAVTAEGGNWIVQRPVYSGKAKTTSAIPDAQLKMILMRPNQLELTAGGATGSIATESAAAPTASLTTLIKEVVQGASKKLDLTEANIIVSGGRGLKDAANFKLLNDLAEVLGGTVGASRAVVDAGWVSHSMQVGQTGKTVAPSLYIAVGISGAIQHLAGMSGSKVIVAINNDPNAPIFQKATYGIVGDLFTVLPLLTEEFKSALHK